MAEGKLAETKTTPTENTSPDASSEPSAAIPSESSAATPTDLKSSDLTSAEVLPKPAGTSSAPPTDSTASGTLDQEALLTMLLEQNRLLEEDSHCTTQISPSSSTNRSQDHSPIVHDPSKADPSSSNDSSQLSPHHQGDDLSSEKLTYSLPDDFSPVIPSPTLDVATPPASATPSVSTPLWDAPSRELESPMEVRSKPKVSAYSPAAVGMAAVEENEDSEEDGGLGPDASIVLQDGLDTRIPYHEVMPEDSNVGMDGKANGGSNVGMDGAGLGEDHCPSVAAPSQDADEEEAVGAESRDNVAELPSAVPTGKGRRQRSETESRGLKGPGIFVPFKGRKRSHTLQEVGMVKEEQDDKPLSVEETQWQQWSDILKNWEDFYPKNAKMVKHLSRRGIPEHLRGMAWQLLSGSINPDLKDRYPTLITEMSPHERAIRRDLNRTFPEHSFFKERDGIGQESLFNVLKAYSVYDKEVGYCQGSPFMVGLLLMQMPEEEAFCVLVQLMNKYKLREVYKPSMADLSLCFYQLEKMIEELYPALSMHFKAVGFQPSMYASPWFLTLFASVLSLSVAFRVMDILLMEGREIVFKVGLALLDDSQEQLLSMDMEDMIKYFQKGMKTVYDEDPDQLISKALKISLNPKKMKKFGKEYLDRKARKTLEISEMARLQNENMEIHQKLAILQQEFDSLREQLIAGQLTRAQQAEEIVLLRNELAVTRKKLAKLESQEEVEKEQRGVGVAAVPEWAETNGHGAVSTTQEPHISKAVSVGTQGQEEGTEHSPPKLLELVKDHNLFDIYKDSSTSPQESPMVMRGVLGMGSKENLFVEDETPDTNSPVVGGHDVKKKKKKKLLSRSKSEKIPRGEKRRDAEQESVGSPPPLSPGTAGSKKEEKERKKREKHKAKELLEKELVLAKTKCADYANLMEVKSLELKQALQREAFLIRELKQVRAEAETKASPESPPSTAPQEPEDTGPNSSRALLANLRAVWNSSPGSSKKDLT